MTTKLSKTQHYQYTNEDGVEAEVSLKYHVPIPKVEGIDDRSMEFVDRQYELCKHALNMELIANQHLFELMRTDMHFMVDACEAFDPKDHDVYRIG